VRKFDNGDRWYFDRIGGDTVLPNGPGQDLHSDWEEWSLKSVHCSTLAASIACADGLVNQAPLEIQAGDGNLYRIVAPKGTVILRDVNQIHRGTANSTSTARVLPRVRFFHAEHLRNVDRRPPRSLSSIVFDEYFPEGFMQDRMAYLWRNY